VLFPGSTKTFHTDDFGSRISPSTFVFLIRLEFHFMKNSVLQDGYLQFLYRIAFERIGSHFPDNAKVIVEIGAGEGVSREFFPTAILTDITFHHLLNANCSSHELPFKSGSIDVITLKDTLHHLPDVEKFLTEASRVLRIGGRIIVFDPYWGIFARFVYRFLHQEKFDTAAKTWSFESSSPWDSNQALSYLLLRRDRKKFEKQFANFKITEHEVLVGPSFLLSGGVSRRTIISARLLKPLLIWELRQSSWFNPLRFFHIFALTKMLD
jgi:SAM-dependent methyltransferase